MKDKPKPVSKAVFWRKLILSILRYLLVPVLCFLALVAGLAIGYVKLGGQPLSEVWKIETWKHLIELVLAKS